MFVDIVILVFQTGNALLVVFNINFNMDFVSVFSSVSVLD